MNRLLRITYDRAKHAWARLISQGDTTPPNVHNRIAYPGVTGKAKGRLPRRPAHARDAPTLRLRWAGGEYEKRRYHERWGHYIRRIHS
ncbi:MAG TPA: hypothetical protein VMV29_11830 [Ktedonobacterales bacterium]|nr:hypothetical protein [Ktedonobacterales bacterium]